MSIGEKRANETDHCDRRRLLGTPFCGRSGVAEYFIKSHEQKALAKRESGVLLTTDNEAGKAKDAQAKFFGVLLARD